MILLYEWIDLVDEIQSVLVENPFESDFLEMIETIPTPHKLLYKNLTKSIAKMNACSRSAEQTRKILCTQSDNLNALQLILPDTLKRKPVHDRILTQILERFGYESFTYLEASTLLRCGHSTAKRKLQPLIWFKKLEKTKHPGANKTLLKITGSKPITENYEAIMEEWEGFTGFEDLTYRT